MWPRSTTHRFSQAWSSSDLPSMGRMRNLMTPQEFAARAVGVPWIRWRSDWDGMDCFGLVVLYFREVHGLDIGPVPHTGVADGFAGQPERWSDSDPLPGAAMWMNWKHGAPSHVGILLTDSTILHSEGQHECGGSVRVTRLDVMERFYGNSRFLRPAAC